MIQHMYKVSEVSPTAGINSHGRVHYRLQIRYHNNCKVKRWTTNLDTNGSMIGFKFESSVEINVFLKSIYKKFRRHPKLKSTSVTLIADCKTRIPIPSKCITLVTHKNTISPLMFIIAETNYQADLRADTCEKLQLIKHIFNIN